MESSLNTITLQLGIVIGLLFILVMGQFERR